MRIDRDTFFSVLPKFDIVPFTQSRGWHDFGNYSNIEYWLDSDVNPNIGFWGIVTQHKILGKRLIIEGLCLKENVSSKTIISFFSDMISGLHTSFIEYSDISEQNAEFEIALRRSGFKRPLALNLCPMTIIVDLRSDFKFHRQWRRQVKKSLESGNSFIVLEHPSELNLKQFVELFHQLRERKALGFDINIPQLKRLTDTEDFFVTFVNDSSGNPLCGRITYLHNGHAYDIFAANSNEGLRSGAVYHNQQGLFEYLKEIGAIDFDYGRIPPGTDDMDNIYIAKSYSGGTPIIYNGQWEYAKSNKINWFYNLYRFALHNYKRY